MMRPPARIWDSLKRFFQRPRRQKFLIIEAYLYLLLARAAVLLLPFKRVASLIGSKGESPVEAVTSDIPAQVQWSIVTASRYAFWNTLCLTQALAAKFMLNRRGIKSTLYLGTTRPSDEKFLAHAWLRCGEMIVTGEQGREGYTVVACFS